MVVEEQGLGLAPDFGRFALVLGFAPSVFPADFFGAALLPVFVGCEEAGDFAVVDRLVGEEGVPAVGEGTDEGFAAALLAEPLDGFVAEGVSGLVFELRGDAFVLETISCSDHRLLHLALLGRGRLNLQ